MSTDGEFVLCKCSSLGFPLCSFCDDDWFCPHCSTQIAFLGSDYQLPEPVGVESSRDPPLAPDHPPRRTGPLLVYPTNHQFEFPLSVRYADSQRRIHHRPPKLDLPRCSVETAQGGFFQTELAIVEASEIDEGEGQLVVRLIPTQQVVSQAPESWYLYLPVAGLEGKLRLRGEFPDRDIDLRICQPPRFSISVRGADVLASRDGQRDGQRDWHHWHGDVYRPDQLELTLVIEALKAPVCFIEELGEEVYGQTDGGLRQTVPAGTILEPGQPLELPLWVDLREWDEENQNSLTIMLPFDRPNYETIELVFHRKDGGKGTWSPPELYQVPELHYGEEYRSQQRAPLTFRNTGQDSMRISPPQVVSPTEHLELDWIRVQWADRGQQEVDLDVGPPLTVDLVLDGTRLSPETVPPGEPLTATIATKDDLGRVWDLRIAVLHVRPPQPLEPHLSIDFGNTNTYAAIRPHRGDASRPVIPLLAEESEAESFPTLIYFQDVSDPENPDFEVGPHAELGAAKYPAASVTGVKRWVGQLERGNLPLRFIRDRHGNEATYDVPTLVRFYLEGIIRLCEQKLRGRATRVGLTFPVKLNDARLQAFKSIGDDLAARLSRPAADGTQREFQVDVQLDEASAVAVEFVFDPLQNKQYIQPRVQQSGQLIVGSFDFGGGTIDTALIEFDFSGGPFGQITSRFLDFGGDANFGGDNVTVAVMELLRARLARLLIQAAADEGPSRIPVANPNSWEGQRAEESHRNNFRYLWQLAERIKIAQCRGDEDRRPLIEQLNAQLGEVVVTTPSGQRPLGETPFWPTLAEAIGQPEFLMTLPEIYQHRMESDLRGGSDYNVQQRVEHCLRELCQSALAKQVSLDFLVMAGAGCHLPLVADCVEDIVHGMFPDAVIHFDRERPKSKVARGQAYYFFGKAMAADNLRITPSTRFTRRAIGVVDPYGNFHPIVPTCSPIDDSQAWYPLPPGSLSYYRRAQDQIVIPLNCQDTIAIAGQPGSVLSPVELGHFLLHEAAVQTGDPVSGTELPDNLSDPYTVEIRMAGSEESILLRVQMAGAIYGHWRMKPAGSSVASESRDDV